MTRRLTRRGFIQGTAAAGLTVLAGPFRPGAYAANDKLNIACIGTGGRGGAHVGAAARENCVALCDIDERHLTGPAKQFPAAKTFADYRRMFDEMAKGIDAVFVATPDHHHAPASMLALAHRKHVYCEKPLTHSIYEARRLAEAARQAKVATQMGNQGMSSEGTRLLVEFIQAGAIGPVREVHVWTDRPVNWWPQGVDRPAYTDPVPAGLDWDLFLGPAPERPYAEVHRDGPFKGKKVYHPFVWRGWWDFGTGALGDIGCHVFDPVFRALKLGQPLSVEASSTRVNKETFPLGSMVTYRFPARGEMPPCTLVWYDGGLRPPRPEGLPDGDELGDNGRLLIGDEGFILENRLYPEARRKAYKEPERTIPRSIGHYREWIEAAKGGKPAGSNFDWAGPLAEVVLLGNVALRVQLRERLTRAKLLWDPIAFKFTNVPEANEFLHRPYREGWTL